MPNKTVNQLPDLNLSDLTNDDVACGVFVVVVIIGLLS